jgi:SAM-dependent methyltransferase
MGNTTSPDPPQPTLVLPGVHRSPNIQGDPDIYEIENNAADPDHRIEAAMWRIAPWTNRIVLDLGSGTGYHLARFHTHAAHVIGVEPHGPSHLRAAQRIANLGLERVSVLRGSAEAIPLADNSVDIVHCRFAYFAGPGSEPGLAEIGRVIRPCGTAFIIDNDLTGGTFAEWLRMEPEIGIPDPAELDRYYRDQGFVIEHIESEWRFQTRQDHDAVVRLEFPPATAEYILRNHKGTRVRYHYLMIHRTF